MKAPQAIMDWSACQNPGGSVGIYLDLANTSPNVAVAFLASCTNPGPTFIQATNVHFRPKALGESFVQALRGKVLSGKFWLHRLVRPFALQARRAFAFYQYAV
jgi:hypothetical protein